MFISSILENLFPPWPGDSITLVGAYFALTGKIPFPVVFTMVNLGGLVGALILYYIGKTKGRSFFMKPGKTYYNFQKLNKVENWISRWGGWLIVGGRFFTGIRSLISITAGIGNMNFNKFSILTLLSFIIWNGLLMGAVFLMKDQFTDIGNFLSSYSKFILIVVAIGITVYLINRYIKFGKGNN
ncbi:MAG: DedA family protein [candidate division Zixibacteria bacterium]|nr:DedA family protein [candidate division Zixibacteria bacterium]